MPIASLTAKITDRSNLSSAEAQEAAHALADTGIPADDKTAFLRALSAKGESVEEVTAFAQVFRTLARDPQLDDWAARGIDIVGTGGDHFGSYNISSTAAFIVAASGIPVLKHGNRAITSKSGTSDFFGEMGIRVDAPVDVLRASLEELNFCFFFAPSWHPAFKEIMPVRKTLAEQGVRTVFNILGPLINPARPAHQLLGVFAENWVKPLADSLHDLGLKRALVAHGRIEFSKTGLDEMTCAGENRVCGAGDIHHINTVWEPEALGLKPCMPEVLKGGSPAENAAMCHELAAGTAPDGLRDTVLLNAATALWIAGRADSIETGLAIARETLASGAFKSWLARSRAFYQKVASA